MFVGSWNIPVHYHVSLSLSLSHRSGSTEAANERHRRNQESIAEEMMGLARSLKENAMAAKTIIVNDNKVYFIQLWGDICITLCSGKEYRSDVRNVPTLFIHLRVVYAAVEDDK